MTEFQLIFVTLTNGLLQFPLELDPWNLIQKHMLEDYINHEASYFSVLFSPFFFLFFSLVNI